MDQGVESERAARRRQLGQRVKHLRAERGLTQIVLSELVGRSKKWLIQVEAGRVEPQFSDLVELASVLQVPPSSLVDDYPLLTTADGPISPQAEAGYLERLCQGHQYRDVLRRTQDLLRSYPRGTLQLVARHFHGRALVNLMRFEEAIPHLVTARSLASASDDVAAEAECMDWEAIARYRLHDPMATDLARQALALYRSLAPGRRWPDVEARMLEHLGACLSASGDYQAAAACFEEALHLPGTIRDLTRVAQSTQNLAICYFQLGHRDRAIALGEQALAVLRTEQELVPPEASYLASFENNLGIAYVRQRNLERGEELLRAAFQHSLTAGDQRIRANVLLSLGELEQQRGRVSDALRMVQHALELAVPLNASRLLVLAYKQLGELHAAEGDRERAEECFQHSLHFVEVAGADGLRAEVELAREGAMRQVPLQVLPEDASASVSRHRDGSAGPY